LSFPFENFIPPNLKIILHAKKRNLDKKFPQLNLDDLSENLNRFSNFINNLRNVLMEKYRKVEQFVRNWEREN